MVSITRGSKEMARLAAATFVQLLVINVFT
jgi:hypothetical protein